MSSPFAAFGNRAAPGRPGGHQAVNLAPQSQGMTMQQLQGMYRSIFSSGNPMQALQQMIGNNPKFAQINGLMRKGMTPEGIFRQMASSRGIDPDDFIRQLQGNNGR